MHTITVIGGGVAGLTAAITCAEQRRQVRLLEAHETLGGRARSTDGPLQGQPRPARDLQGRHALGLAAPARPDAAAGPPAADRLSAFTTRDAIHRTPPLSLIPPGLRLRGRMAPVDQDFRSWVTDHSDAHTADMLVVAGRGLHLPPRPRRAVGRVRLGAHPAAAADSATPPATVHRRRLDACLVDALERHARSLGVTIVTGERVDALPSGTVIVALELPRRPPAARTTTSLDWPSGSTLCLDLGLSKRRGDPWIVSDLESSGWTERYTAQDPSLAPAGRAARAGARCRSGRARAPTRPGARLERLLDAAFEGWRDRVTWRRRQVMDGRSGALDLPGTTWRDRPAIDRGDGVFLCGDQVAAPGCLAEVSFASAIEAGTLALANASRGALPRVA